MTLSYHHTFSLSSFHLFLVYLSSCRAQTVSEIIVDVLDENDTPPKFEKDSYSEFVSENAPVGTIIAELRATDADTPANTDLVYSFSANSVKGLSSSADREIHVYRLTFNTCTDSPFRILCD